MNLTNLPWKWTRPDRATLSLSGPDEMKDIILFITKCNACVENNQQCNHPKIEDAAVIAASPKLYYILKCIIEYESKEVTKDEFAYDRLLENMKDAAKIGIDEVESQLSELKKIFNYGDSK